MAAKTDLTTLTPAERVRVLCAEYMGYRVNGDGIVHWMERPNGSWLRGGLTYRSEEEMLRRNVKALPDPARNEADAARLMTKLDAEGVCVFRYPDSQETRLVVGPDFSERYGGNGEWNSALAEAVAKMQEARR